MYKQKNFQTEPPVVTQHIAKHTHILFGLFSKIKAKIDLLISYKIPSLKILKGLYIFDRSEEALQRNYDHLRKNGLKEIMPWMLASNKNTIKK